MARASCRRCGAALEQPCATLADKLAAVLKFDQAHVRATCPAVERKPKRRRLRRNRGRRPIRRRFFGRKPRPGPMFPPAPISERAERRVRALLLRGLSAAQIRERVGCSEQDIERVELELAEAGIKPWWRGIQRPEPPPDGEV